MAHSFAHPQDPSQALRQPAQPEEKRSDELWQEALSDIASDARQQSENGYPQHCLVPEGGE